MNPADGHAPRSGGEGSPSLTAAAIAAAVSGRLVGDGDATVTAVAPLDRAGAGDLSFLTGPRYAPLFEKSDATVVLVAPDVAEVPGRPRARIIVDKPHEALLALLPRLYVPPVREPGIHPTVTIGRGATIADGATIGPYVVIEDGASIGEGSWLESHVVVGRGAVVGTQCRLHPGVVLYSGARLGDRVQIHSGARIGSDGFGYVFGQGAHRKIPHVGRCIIENDVEIGANTTIDRGSIDDTVIGAGTKIDNLVHLGHNVRVGRLCLIMAQVGVSGSTHIGDGVIIAGQAGIQGHIEIGDRVRIGGQAGVFGSVPSGETWSGYPARPHRESLRAQAAVFRLSSIIRSLEKLVSGAERDR